MISQQEFKVFEQVDLSEYDNGFYLHLNGGVTQMTEEEYKNKNFMVVSSRLDITILTKDGPSKINNILNNTTARKLKILCLQPVEDVTELASLISKLNVTELTFESIGNRKPCFPNGIIKNPVMANISSLSGIVAPDDEDLEEYFQENFKNINYTFLYTSPRELAHKLNKMLQKWWRGEQQIEHYVINSYLFNYIEVILNGWKVIMEQEEIKNEKLQALAVREPDECETTRYKFNEGDVASHVGVGDQRDAEKPTLLDFLLNAPVLVFEEILEYTDVKTCQNLLMVDYDLRARCLYTSRVVVYKPWVIEFEDGNLLFDRDDQGVRLTEKQFKITQYKVVTPRVFLQALTDEAVDQLLTLFYKRVTAKVLSIEEIQCDINKVAQLMKELKPSSLSVGSPLLYDTEEFDFPIELIKDPVMNELEELIAKVPLHCDLEVFIAKNFKRLTLCLENSADVNIAHILNQTLHEWLRGERVIQKYSFWDVCIKEYTENLLHGWTVVNEEEEKQNAFTFGSCGCNF